MGCSLASSAFEGACLVKTEIRYFFPFSFFSASGNRAGVASIRNHSRISSLFFRPKIHGPGFLASKKARGFSLCKSIRGSRGHPCHHNLCFIH